MSAWMPFVAVALVFVVGGYLFWAVGRLLILDKIEDDEERRALWPGQRDRMLRAAGFWQWCVAFVLLTMPDSQPANTVGLFGVGAVLMWWPRFNRKLNERLG